MRKSELEKIAREGAVIIFCDRARNELWNARTALEDSGKNNFKEWKKFIEKARLHIDRAEAFIKEAKQ